MNLQQTNGRDRQRPLHWQQPTLTKSDQRVRLLELSIGLMIAQTKAGEFWENGFSEAAELLEAIPLMTTDFDAARRHLANARAYCRLHEYGAATFELRVVRGILLRL